MALTPEEELELQQLEEEQSSLSKELSTMRSQMVPQKIEPADTIEDYTPETSPLEAGLRGAAQGLTFEHADEIAARIESLTTGKPYEQALAESRAEHKLAQEEHPVASIAGNIAGGVAQGVGLTALTGGAAAPAAGASALSRLAQLGKAALVPSMGKGALKNIGSAALTGATMGGLTGIGASEKEGLEALKEAPSAALSGGVIGGALGGAVEGVKGAAGAIGRTISKGVEEGRYPTFVRMMKLGKELGEEGKEFFSEASQKRPLEAVSKATKETIIPELNSALKSTRELRNYLMAKSTNPVDVDDTINSLETFLKNRPESDAGDILKNVKGFLKKATPDTKTPKLYDAAGNIISSSEPSTKQLSALEAYGLRKELEDIVNRNEELPAEIKKSLYGAIDSIKEKIRSSIDEQQALQLVNEDPNLLNTYQRLVKDAPEDLKNKPVAVLDQKMSGILNASEILGDINPANKTEAEKIKDIEKVFKNIISQPKETAGAFLSEQKYNQAMKYLADAYPEVAEKIQAEVKPLVRELDFQRYIQGEGFDRGTKEGGFIKKTLGDIGKLSAEGINLMAVAKKAAKEGTRGPIPGLPSPTILRPTVAVMSKVKNNLQTRIQSEPNNKVYGMFNEMLDNALSQKDESRRAAVLNTLMQYKVFRDMMKESEAE